MHDIVSDVNRSKRQLLMLRLLTGLTDIVWQVMKWKRMFDFGSPHQIHGKITTLLMNHATERPGRGSSKVTPSRNGSGPGQALFYGFMENVRCHQLLRFV
jgi:hypothetical protein